MGFESCHPAVNFLFFAAVVYGSAAFQHPVFLAISCLCAFAFSMKRNHAAFDYVYDHGQIRMIFVPLLENAAFRDRFLQRLAYHCRVTFQRENVLRVFEPLVEAVEGEIPRNTARWEYHPSSFPNNIKRIRTRIVDYDRPMELISDISDRLALKEAEQERYFGDLLHE